MKTALLFCCVCCGPDPGGCRCCVGGAERAIFLGDTGLRLPVSALTAPSPRPPRLSRAGNPARRPAPQGAGGACLTLRGPLTGISSYLRVSHHDVLGCHLLVVALVAALFGFGGIAGTAIEAAKLVFFVAIVLFAISAVVGLMRGRAPRV